MPIPQQLGFNLTTQYFISKEPCYHFSKFIYVDMHCIVLYSLMVEMLIVYVYCVFAMLSSYFASSCQI